MRRVLIAAAAVAACGLMSSGSAFAQSQYQAGGPSRVGNMCRVGTDEGGSAAYGYYRSCPPDQQAKAVKPRKKKSS